jgi:hypothetical protein
VGITNSTRSSAPSIEVICESFKPFVKNTLQGFAMLVFPAIGVRIFECSFHKKSDTHYWVGFPSRAYEQGGQKKYARLIEATEQSWHYAQQDEMVEAIHKFLLFGAKK